MNRKIKELKRIARGNLTSNYKMLIRAYLWVLTIPMILELPFEMLQTEESGSTQNSIYYIAQLLIGIISAVLVCGEYKLHLSLARTKEMTMSDFFVPLKNQPDRYILANLILTGILFLGLIPIFIAIAILSFVITPTTIAIASALGIVGLVIVTYISITYQFVFFILLDNPEFSAIYALKNCAQFMKSHKKRLLYLQLSFIGVYLLSLLSLGIGFLWAEPYLIQTTTLFYLELRGELNPVEHAPEPTVINQYV